MITAVVDFSRLAFAAWTLARHDALVPREFARHAPFLLRLAGSMLRAGAAGKDLRPGERLAVAFQKLGPAYVKLGQFMATRPDIVGFEFAADLGQLQDRMHSFSRKAACRELEKAFGKPVDDLFLSFSEPIAAASIAQAHRATLKDGTEVAIKILRPGIEVKAGREFRAFARAARFIEAVSRSARRLEPVRFIETLKVATAIELDLRLEAGAASELEQNMAGRPDVRVPRIIWPLTAKRVVTMEWISGISPGDLPALDAAGIDRRELARRLVRVFLFQALHDGFFHADLHQGNMLIDREGRLCLIDFGIMGRLDANARRTFAEIIYGFISRNYRRAADVHFEAGYVPEGQCRDTFAQALRAVGEPLHGRNAREIDMSRVLQQLFDVTAMFSMHLRPELILFQRTMVTAEGVARVLDPDIDMWETATPVIESYIAGMAGLKAGADGVRAAIGGMTSFVPRIPRYIETIAGAARCYTRERTAAAGSSGPPSRTRTGYGLPAAFLAGIILASACTAFFSG